MKKRAAFVPTPELAAEYRAIFTAANGWLPARYFQTGAHRKKCVVCGTLIADGSDCLKRVHELDSISRYNLHRAGFNAHAKVKFAHVACIDYVLDGDLK